MFPLGTKVFIVGCKHSSRREIRRLDMCMCLSFKGRGGGAVKTDSGQADLSRQHYSGSSSLVVVVGIVTEPFSRHDRAQRFQFLIHTGD